MRPSQLLQLPAGPALDLTHHGLALDTVVTSATNPGAGPTAFTTTASGDTLVVRNFNLGSDTAKLIQICRRGGTSGFFRVRSPLLHDNVRGIMITTGETPSLLGIPAEFTQPLTAQDTLIAEGSGGAAETDLGILSIFYSNLAGSAARLHMRGDVSSIKSLRPITVAVTSSATIGAWTDTVITTTEDLTHANTDYAVLGYIANVALGWVAIKGIDTGNLRVGGPGTINVEDSSNYFVWQSDRHGLPFIPVFNSANKGGTFVSVVDSGASTAATITLICVELASNLSN